MCARLLLALAVMTAGLVTLPSYAAGGPPAPASFTEHVYDSPQGSRHYWLYLPPRAGGRSVPRPLVVVLHGCEETALDTATATHFNALAAARGFVVVYPQQNVTANSSAPLADGNGIGCWNWFLPADQTRGSGEPAIIAGITEQVAASQDVDPERVYVEGMSAGADLAVILGATYPDIYAAVGVLAGCSYATCGDPTGVLTNRAMGPRARMVPIFVENGSADTLNPLPLAVGLVSSWLGADDLADDGSMNDSISRAPASVVNDDVDQQPSPGSGDACIHYPSWTCPGGVVGFQGNYPTTVTTWDDATGCDVAELWVLHGMEHAHPDAPGDGPYTDPLGPDITTASYDFFQQHPMTGGCSG